MCLGHGPLKAPTYENEPILDVRALRARLGKSIYGGKHL